MTENTEKRAEETESQKADTIEALAKKYLAEGKTTDEKIALFMARETKAKEAHKARSKELKQALKAQEKILKEKERKARTRHLIQLGGLIEKSGLGDEDKGVVYGALLEAKKALDGPQGTMEKARFKKAGASLVFKDSDAEKAEPLFKQKELV